MRYCTQGHANPDDAVFCGNCGQPMSATVGSAYPAGSYTAAPSYAPGAPTGYSTGYAYPPQPLPEGYVLIRDQPVKVAGYWQRSWANSIDTLLMLLAAAALLLIFAQWNATMGGLIFFLVLLLGWPIWTIMAWANTGQTLGKKWMGIKVVRTDGSPLSTGDAVWRAVVACFVTSLLTAGIGYLRLVWHPQRQATHDRICGTYVICTR